MSLSRYLLFTPIALLIFSCNKPFLIAETESAQSEVTDPLPSWNEGANKAAIIAFVEQVTEEGNANYVEAGDRIATFDNDGCLWSEQPMYFQLFFILDRVRAMAAEHPEWKDKPLFAAVLENDLQTVMSFGTRGLLELTMASSAGMNSSQFENLVKNWVDTAKHPTSNKRFIDMTYQPMKELLAYLRANGFKTYIV